TMLKTRTIHATTLGFGLLMSTAFGALAPSAIAAADPGEPDNPVVVDSGDAPDSEAGNLDTLDSQPDIADNGEAGSADTADSQPDNADNGESGSADGETGTAPQSQAGAGWCVTSGCAKDRWGLNADGFHVKVNNDSWNFLRYSDQNAVNVDSHTTSAHPGGYF